VTAENVASDNGVSRQDQDALAAESHRRAAAATEAVYFKEQIMPIEVKGRKGTVTVDTDEHIRPGVTTDDLAKLRPSFAADGTVTPGNASGINDAAAAVVVASGSFADERELSPLGRLVAYSHAGVEPRIMGMGPVPAVRKVLDRAGLKLDEIDLFEVNEAFAAQALAVIRELGLPPSGPTPTAAASPRAPGRRDRRHPRRQGPLRAAPDQRQARAHHHVHRWRAGHRSDLRARLTRVPAVTQLTSLRGRVLTISSRV